MTRRGFVLPMLPDWYVLDEYRQPRQPKSLQEYADAMTSDEKRRVGSDTVGRFWVSTVFLGVNHNYSGKGPSICFETMVFEDGKPTGEQHRYSTWDDAAAGHAAAVRRCERAVKQEAQP